MNEEELNETSSSTELSSCPFCGHRCDLKEPDTLYPAGIYWADDEDIGRSYFGRNHKKWIPDLKQCWQINCVTVSGGCGAQIIGHSKEETVAKWQRRAT